MAVIDDPIAYVPEGAFAPRAHYKVYKGALPSTAGYLSEGQAQDDGSISGKARGVPVGTEICVVSSNKDGEKVIATGTAGATCSIQTNALPQDKPAHTGMNIPEPPKPARKRQAPKQSKPTKRRRSPAKPKAAKRSKSAKGAKK